MSTFQIEDSLIINGKQTFIMDFPPLPKNHPNIIKSKTESSLSICWRGYFAEWEIINSELFLKKLTGNFRLKDEQPLFACWFSGEIIHSEESGMGYCIFSREDSIKVNNGKVIPSLNIEERPTPWQHYKNDIKKFVESRGITSLIHFTRLENISSILHNGLIGRYDLELPEYYQGIVFNDDLRLDDSGAICASISFPNYKMFYSLQKKNPNVDWVIFKLDPRILWEIKCAFCITNAASKEVVKIPIHLRTGIKPLSLVFEDILPYIFRKDLGIPDNYTTDPQAEVLILEDVSESYILDVVLKDEDSMEKVKHLFKSFGRSRFTYDKSLFKYRIDYEHWTN